MRPSLSLGVRRFVTLRATGVVLLCAVVALLGPLLLPGTTCIGRPLGCESDYGFQLFDCWNEGPLPPSIRFALTGLLWVVTGFIAARATQGFPLTGALATASVTVASVALSQLGQCPPFEAWFAFAYSGAAVGAAAVGGFLSKPRIA
jgi:hypothetical protein